MDRVTLKQTLESFDLEQPVTDTLDCDAVLTAMLEHIGDLDPHLRDDLIYTTFLYWTLQHNAISDEQLSSIVRVLIDDQHLFFQIDQIDATSVFRRSFSALWLPVIVNKHKNQPFLSPEQLTEIGNAIIQYLQRERDLRGYTEHGWAHGLAHASDVVGELAKCEGITPELWHTLLKTLGSRLFNPEYAFVYEEDERFANALITMLAHNRINSADFLAWLQANIDVVEAHDLTNFRYLNTKNFIRSLYAQSHAKPELQVINEQVHAWVVQLHQ